MRVYFIMRFGVAVLAIPGFFAACNRQAVPKRR